MINVRELSAFQSIRPHVRGALRTDPEPLGACRRLRHYAQHGEGMALRAGSQLSRAPSPGASPQFRQAPDEVPEALLSGHRSCRLASRDTDAPRTRWPHTTQCAGALFECWVDARRLRKGRLTSQAPGARDDSSSGASRAGLEVDCADRDGAQCGWPSRPSRVRRWLPISRPASGAGARWPEPPPRGGG